jgi:hypothetical protein
MQIWSGCNKGESTIGHIRTICEAIKDFDDLSKLGQGFTSADPLEEVDIGDGTVPRLTFVNKNLDPLFKSDLIKLLKEYVDCFAWNSWFKS